MPFFPRHPYPWFPPDNGAAILYIYGGASSGTPLKDCDGWDGLIWNSFTDIPYGANRAYAFSLNGIASVCGGNFGQGATDYHYGWNEISWTSLTDVPSPSRFGGNASVLGSVGFICGGRRISTSTGFYSDCDGWDSFSWTAYTDIPSSDRGRTYFSASTLNSNIYIGGGYSWLFSYGAAGTMNTWDSFDGISWTNQGVIPRPTTSGGAPSGRVRFDSSTIDSKIYIYAGYGYDFNIDKTLTMCDSWDDLVWVAEVDMPLPKRQDLTAETASLIGYVAGGSSGSSSSIYRDFDGYDTISWTSYPDLSSGRGFCTSSTL